MTERESGRAGERESGAAGSLDDRAPVAWQPEAGREADGPGIDAHSPALPLSHSDVLAWLDARAAAPPPELRERMAAALAAVTSETVPGALAEAALSCLQATMAAGGERASALDLLAADALLTYALEAAAEMKSPVIVEAAKSEIAWVYSRLFVLNAATA